ncbi:MAG TPA: ester cyclase [Mycobacteriales bacterium]|nr:ester cyclase [Mycobacteriales bacterium]
MTTQGASVIDRYYAAFNARDWAAYDDLFTADAVLETPSGNGVGPEAVRAFDSGLVTGYSDFTITTLGRYATGDRVASENLAEGVHDGPFPTPAGEIPASGNQVGGKYVGLFELRDGRISAQRIYYDQLALVEQMTGTV